jgi:hypothetical protein
MAELSARDFAAAKRRGEWRMRGPCAESAHYDADRNRIVVRLTTGVEIGFAPADVEGLANASTEELELIEVQELGLGLHFPKLDADLYVPALLEGALGSKRWMAARLGAAGGRARSPAKVAASRQNGKRGGRPLKTLEKSRQNGAVTVMQPTIADDATIADIVNTLIKPGEYIRNVLEKLWDCNREYGNAAVRIGTLGHGRAPNYRNCSTQIENGTAA